MLQLLPDCRAGVSSACQRRRPRCAINDVKEVSALRHICRRRCCAVALRIQLTGVAPQIKKDIFDFVYVCRNDQMMPDLEASHRIYRMILTLLSGITNAQTGTPLSARFFQNSEKHEKSLDSIESRLS